MNKIKKKFFMNICNQEFRNNLESEKYMKHISENPLST